MRIQHYDVAAANNMNKKSSVALWWLQLNTLQQLQNIASYSFLLDKLQSDSIRLHALWFDIQAGDFYMFSRSQQRFLNVTEENWEHFIVDSEKPKSKLVF